LVLMILFTASLRFEERKALLAVFVIGML
jgi:hypothetical protein